MIWPFGNAFNRYYGNFEHRACLLDPTTIEQELSSSTYKHQLREMFTRLGVGLALYTGISILVRANSADQPLISAAYMLSVPLQCIAIILPSVTRNIMIGTEQRILQQELAKKQHQIKWLATRSCER